MFTSAQYVLLALALLLYTSSLIAFKKHRENIVLVSLFTCALAVFSFGATLDDFLNLWDERFHFLVAKNMMENPLAPMLYADPVLNMEYDWWSRSHIWLHKQPLFMWQMALSMKLFGANEFAGRLPSVILSALVVIALYRSGTLLANRLVGLVAATLMLTSFYWIELVSGRGQLDQNDVAFLSYINLSIWAFIEYHFSKKKRWLLLLAVFSGFAILCKWLAGLFVYAIWGLYIILNQSDFKSQLKELLKALGTTVLIAAPWQIYIAIRFPAEAAMEQAYNFNHLWEPVEAHGGPWTYYIDKLPAYFGLPSALIILIIAFVVGLIFSQHKKLLLTLFVAFVSQLAFFSWAATKMPSFAMVGWFIGILYIAILIEQLVALSQSILLFRGHLAIIGILACVVIVPLRFMPGYFESMHGINGDYADHIRAQYYNKELFSNLDLSPDYVILNIKGYHYIEAMFYTGLPAYNVLADEEQLADLKQKGRRIAVFSHGEKLPGYYLNDDSILILDKETLQHE